MSKNGFKSLIGSLVFATALSASGNAFANFEGFGKDIPLSSAASQIVPGNYSVDYDNGVDSSVLVSWDSAKDWQTALRAAVAKKGLSAAIGSNAVIISKASAPSSPKPSTKPYSSSPDGKAQTNKPRPQAPKAAAPTTPVETPVTGGGGFSIRPYKANQGAVEQPAAPASNDARLATKGDFKPYAPTQAVQYSVSSGQMLRGVLNEWATKSGWRLIWESEYDYLIEADASFNGDFIKATSSLRDAMAGARPVITIDFHSGNNVVVVSNKSADAVN